jgi:hypothetical protein
MRMSKQSARNAENVNLSFLMLWNDDFVEAAAFIEEAHEIAAANNRGDSIEMALFFIRSYLALMKETGQDAELLLEKRFSEFAASPGASVGLISLAGMLLAKTKPQTPQFLPGTLVEPLSDRELEVLNLIL